MKEYTENELKTKAEAYCAKTERCPFEVEQKLTQWGPVGSGRGDDVPHPDIVSERPFH